MTEWIKVSLQCCKYTHKHDQPTDAWIHYRLEMIPFAVVGSNQEYQVNGKRLLGRKTKWGTIEGNSTHTTITLPVKLVM